MNRSQTNIDLEIVVRRFSSEIKNNTENRRREEEEEKVEKLGEEN